MGAKVNRQWRLAARPVGLIKESDFEWREEPVPTPGDGEILVRNIYLSLDPANRGWVREGKSYVPPVATGEVMRGIAIGVVEQSHRADFRVGDIVQGMLGWQGYALTDGAGLTPVTKRPVPSVDNPPGAIWDHRANSLFRSIRDRETESWGDACGFSGGRCGWVARWADREDQGLPCGWHCRFH